QRSIPEAYIARMVSLQGRGSGWRERGCPRVVKLTTVAVERAKDGEAASRALGRAHSPLERLVCRIREGEGRLYTVSHDHSGNLLLHVIFNAGWGAVVQDGVRSQRVALVYDGTEMLAVKT